LAKGLVMCCERCLFRQQRLKSNRLTHVFSGKYGINHKQGAVVEMSVSVATLCRLVEREGRR